MNSDSFDSLLIIGASKFTVPYLEKYFIDDKRLISERNLYYEQLPPDFAGSAIAVVCDLSCIRNISTKGIVYAAALSSTAVYDATEGLNFNEETLLITNSDTLKDEKLFSETFRSVPNIVLRLPELVIGTAMDNLGIEMAHQIYKGTYMHIENADGHCSTIHASHIPEALLLCINNDITGTYNLTDGTNTPIKDLAEALSLRLGDKRIFTISDKRARFIRIPGKLFGIKGWCSKMYDFKKRNLTFSSEKLLSAINYRPTPVIDYLKTHNYDENSL